MNPVVSVIMNCYNGERFVRAALESVYAQTLQDFEIIFWDNASTDRSGDIAREFDQRTRYFRANENRPLGEARRVALEQANGDFVTFLDVDDLWLPKAIETLREAIQRTDAAVAYAGVIEVDLAGRELRTVTPATRFGNLLPALLLQFDINVSALMIRRAVLVESGLTFDPNVTASEEYCLLMQLAARYPFVSISQPTARYLIHSGSLSSLAMANWATEREYTLRKLCQFDSELTNRYPEEFAEAFARATYYRARYLMAQGNRRDARREMKRVAKQHGRYLALYLLLFGPAWLWDLVHRFRGRSTQR